MHQAIFCILCIVSVGLSALGAMLESEIMLYGLLLSVAVVGVPHGGLDHLTGRSVLQPYVGPGWVPTFFVGYVAIAAIVVLGWYVMPLTTALLFFLVSAWHFGVEDDSNDFEQTINMRSRLGSDWRDEFWFKRIWLGVVWRAVRCTAVGGLVIWIPAVVRPAEMSGILDTMVPASFAMSGIDIVRASAWLAYAFLPIAIVDLSLACRSPRGRADTLRNLCLVGMLAATPIVVSFGFYFCGWHSLRGLDRLRNEHNLNWHELAMAVLPLSIGAIVLIGGGAGLLSTGQPLSSQVTAAMFVGLSAIAVPHLVLHSAFAVITEGCVADGYVTQGWVPAAHEHKRNTAKAAT